MISNCANLECCVEFDARGGRFFCFHRLDFDSEVIGRIDSGEYYWLCEDCSKLYTLEYGRGETVVVALPIILPADDER